MDSIPCPICGECQWDVDDCIEVEEVLGATDKILKLRQLNEKLTEELKEVKWAFYGVEKDEDL